MKGLRGRCRVCETEKDIDLLGVLFGTNDVHGLSARHSWNLEPTVRIFRRVRRSGIYVPGRIYAQGTWMQERECLKFEARRKSGSLRPVRRRRSVSRVRSLKRPCSDCHYAGRQALDEENAGTISSLLRLAKAFSEWRGKATISSRPGIREHVIRLGDFKELEFYELSFVSSVIPEFAG